MLDASSIAPGAVICFKRRWLMIVCVMNLYECEAYVKVLDAKHTTRYGMVRNISLLFERETAGVFS